MCSVGLSITHCGEAERKYKVTVRRTNIHQTGKQGAPALICSALNTCSSHFTTVFPLPLSRHGNPPMQKRCLPTQRMSLVLFQWRVLMFSVHFLSMCKHFVNYIIVKFNYPFEDPLGSLNPTLRTHWSWLVHQS